MNYYCNRCEKETWHDRGNCVDCFKITMKRMNKKELNYIINMKTNIKTKIKLNNLKK